VFLFVLFWDCVLGRMGFWKVGRIWALKGSLMMWLLSLFLSIGGLWEKKEISIFFAMTQKTPERR